LPPEATPRESSRAQNPARWSIHVYG